MKFLKLDIIDFDLYSIDENTDFIDHLESNIPALKRFYYDQGDDFWLRHLLTFRQHFYILIQARFEHEEGQCLHWIINPLEKIFIQIHKLVIIKGFEAVKKSLKSIKRNAKKANLDAIPYLTNKEKFQLITTCSAKIAYKSLFGSNIGNSKAATIKTYLAIDLYKYFCKTISILLTRYESANTISADDDKSYWTPFPHWTKNYEPELFENYLTRIYKDQLAEKILLPGAYQILHCKSVHKCCQIFIKNYNSKLLKGETDFYKQKIYQSCSKHNSCFLRLVHDENCQNPQFCTLTKHSCNFICDTDVFEKKIKSTNDTKYWKTHIITTYPSSKKNCRDVNTLTETYKSAKNLEQYPFQTVGYDWDDETDSPLWRELPPDFANFARQLEKKEKTKSRLRDKLSKKSRSSSRDKNLHFHSGDMTNMFTDFKFRFTVFCQAQAVFRNELGDEFLCRLLKDKVGKSDMPLIDLFEGKYEADDFVCSQKTSVNTKSIGVGWNVPCNWQFLADLKLAHIKKKLELKICTPIVMDVTENNSKTKIDISDNSVLKNSIENLSARKKSKLAKKLKGAMGIMGSKNVSVQNTTQKPKCNISNNAIEIINTIVEPHESGRIGPKQLKIKTKIDMIINENSKKNSPKKSTKLNSPLLNKEKITETIPATESEEIQPNTSNTELVRTNEKVEMTNNDCKQSDIDEHKLSKSIENMTVQQNDDIVFSNQPNATSKQVDGYLNSVLETKEFNPISFKDKSIKLRICAYCGKLEPTRHSFKKCKLCKDQMLKNARYYCGKVCQTKDWKENHNSDHKEPVVN